jgi:hypothetical protein
MVLEVTGSENIWNTGDEKETCDFNESEFVGERCFE